ncbi:hypothetical protein DMP23_43000 [Amycolatopsis sp. A1MSW2902]|uniref:ABC transporter substrate-binding protein n=1 Tax=Amycolatopsis sp. A1MSW2902 TaxID=687413 RepID=UPI00307EBC17
MNRTRSVAAAGLAVALLSAGCSTIDKSSAETAGPGVTKDSITLGYLTDLSGPASASGKVNYHGAELYINQLNKNGGVCGRQVKLTAQDHQYDPQKALSLYRESEPDVLGYVSTLGTPVLSSLSSRFKSDQVLTTTLAWDYSLLANNSFITVPSTSDMDMVAGLGYLNENGLLHKGDAVGEIYIQGLGVSQVPGVDYAAQQLGLTVQKVEVAPTSSDMTSQIQRFKDAGVKVIAAEGLPTQTAAIATAATSAGLNVPILTGTAGFVSQLMTTGAASALQQHLYVPLGWSPYSADNAAINELRAAYQADPGGVEADAGLVNGWSQAKVYTDIIAKSCDQLTRAGLEKAYRSISDLKVTGLLPDLDFSHPGKPAARAYNITRPDSTVQGGLKMVSQPFITPSLLAGYQPPEG